MNYRSKTDTVLIVAYACLGILLFYFWVEPSLLGDSIFRFSADSTSYMKRAEETASINFNPIDNSSSGPTILLKIFNNSLIQVAVFNFFIFLFGYYVVIKAYKFRIEKNKFLLLLMINPMILFSILTPSKESFSLLSIPFLAAFIANKNRLFLMMSITFSILTRWHQSLAIIIFYLLSEFGNNFAALKNRKHYILIGFIFLLSAVYIPAFDYLNSMSDAGDALENEYTKTSSGVIIELSNLQNKGLFFLVLIPKLLINLIGNLKPEGLIPVLDVYGGVDIYNTLIISGHQLCFVTVTIMVVKKIKQAREVNSLQSFLNEDMIFFGSIFSIVFSLTPFVQSRYFLPVYLILVLYLSVKSNQCE